MEEKSCVSERGGCLCTTLSGEKCDAFDPACPIDFVGFDSSGNEPSICECRNGSWMCYSSARCTAEIEVVMISCSMMGGGSPNPCMSTVAKVSNAGLPPIVSAQLLRVAAE